MLVAGKVPGLADDPDAMRWLKKAAKGGDAQAQFDLGCRHILGIGVPEDSRRAERWLVKAAEAGFAPEAQHELGAAYETGEGVEKDEVEAARWYRMAAGRRGSGP